VAGVGRHSCRQKRRQWAHSNRRAVVAPANYAGKRVAFWGVGSIEPNEPCALESRKFAKSLKRNGGRGKD
jgi:hypothetical protein